MIQLRVDIFSIILSSFSFTLSVCEFLTETNERVKNFKVTGGIRYV